MAKLRRDPKHRYKFPTDPVRGAYSCSRRNDRFGSWLLRSKAHAECSKYRRLNIDGSTTAENEIRSGSSSDPVQTDEVIWMSSRRTFLVSVTGALLAAPLCVRAQQRGKAYRIGFVWDSPTVWPHALEAFRQGLRALGWIEGQNIVIE